MYSIMSGHQVSSIQVLKYFLRVGMFYHKLLDLSVRSYSVRGRIAICHIVHVVLLFLWVILCEFDITVKSLI